MQNGAAIGPFIKRTKKLFFTMFPILSSIGMKIFEFGITVEILPFFMFSVMKLSPPMNYPSMYNYGNEFHLDCSFNSSLILVSFMTL